MCAQKTGSKIFFRALSHLQMTRDWSCWTSRAMITWSSSQRTFKLPKKTVKLLFFYRFLIETFYSPEITAFAVRAVFSGMKYLDDLGCNSQTNLEICYHLKKAEEIIYRRSQTSNLISLPRSEKILFVEAFIRLVCVLDSKPEWKVDAFKFVDFNIKHRNSVDEIAFLNYWNKNIKSDELEVIKNKNSIQFFLLKLNLTWIFVIFLFLFPNRPRLKLSWSKKPVEDTSKKINSCCNIKHDLPLFLALKKW